MDVHLTEQQKKLSRRYITYRALAEVWFVSAIWLYFYRIFITDYQVGILDGIAFAVGLIAEVPSGALADRFGRKRLVILGQTLVGAGMLLQACGSSFAPFLIGQSILMIGASFVSGADQALFFDKLQFTRNSTHWRRLVTRVSQIELIVRLFGIVLGGWLYTFNPRLPWILTGIVFIGSIIPLWSITEERSKEVVHSFLHGTKAYLASIKEGFSIFYTSKLRRYVPLIITVQGLFYTAGWGILRIILLDRFYFSPFAGSIVIATSALITVGILTYMHRYAEHLSEKRVLIIISLTAVASTILPLANIGMWGYVVILMLYAGEHVLHPFMSEILNNQAQDYHRATVLSVASFLRILPYVVLAPIIGYLNTQRNLEYFLITWAVLVCIAIYIYLHSKKDDTSVSLIEKEMTSDPIALN